MPKLSARFKAILMIGLVLIGSAIEFYQRSNLADPLPFLLTAVGAVAGALFGYWVFAELYQQSPERWAIKQKFGILSGALIGLFLGTLIMRAIFLQIVFAGVAASSTPAKVEVVSKGTSCDRHGEGNCRLNVVLETDAREFRVLVTHQVYKTIDPNPNARTHCLLLEVETGRFGFRRVYAPNYNDAPIELDRYSLC